MSSSEDTGTVLSSSLEDRGTVLLSSLIEDRGTVLLSSFIGSGKRGFAIAEKTVWLQTVMKT